MLPETELISKTNLVDHYTPLLYEVIDRELEYEQVVTLTLAPTTEEQLPEMQPGQFNMIYRFGLGEIPISVSSLGAPSPQIVHTIQKVGPISNSCFNAQKGEVLGLRGPFGTTWPVEKAKGKDILIMVGGLGLAPLRPVIEKILENRDQFKNVSILFGARNPDSLLFRTDIISWQADPSINFQITVDHSFRYWRGHIGVVTELMNWAKFDPDNCVAMICGPEIMMRYAQRAISGAGVDDQDIFFSMERNMKCAIGQCGHCQFGPAFVCKDGPVFTYHQMKSYLNISEL